MKYIKSYTVGMFVLLATLAACGGSKYSYHRKHEVTMIKIRPGEPMDLLAFSALEDVHNNQQLASSRAAFLGAYGSTAIGMAITGMKTLIKHEQAKYHDQYEFDIIPQGHHIQNDSFYFYKGISDLAFDPTDMQFNGFTIVRLVGQDTAMRAVFEVDKTNPTEIFYDGVFRLKLKELVFNYSKAKVPAKGVKGVPRVNLDFDIDLYASFVSSDGRLNNNINIGKFNLNLAGVALHNADSCKQFAGRRLDGFSFLVPRSYGYSVASRKSIYNQGSFSIHVNVKETANRKLVGRLMTQYQDQIIASMNYKPKERD